MTCVTLALGIAGPTWTASKVVLSPYAPFPKAASTSLGASFARPTHAEVVSIRVCMSRANAVGLTQAGNLPKGAQVTLRLGLFHHKRQSFAQERVLAYAVIFDDFNVPSYGEASDSGGVEPIFIGQQSITKWALRSSVRTDAPT